MNNDINQPVKIIETIFRDAPQSLIATRMSTDEMLPIVDVMDQVGYHAVECWGGATFDTALRFLKEDPWERLRLLRDGFKHTKLQMLLRGQNLLGYAHYADDVVDYFCRKAVANGIDIIRTMDCLNDTRNLETAVKATKAEGGHCIAALVYTTGEAYTLEYWKDVAKRLEDLGADEIGIKDMAGLLDPYKEVTDLPIAVHTHYTAGLASMTYLKAVEAGCYSIDTAISPLSMGTSQPATEVMCKALAGTPRDPGVNMEKLLEVSDYFANLREKYLKSGQLNVKMLETNIKTLRYQVPGGMLSNLVAQLTEAGKMDRYQEVLEEIPRVRKDFGEPPLVTPSSQIVGTQAVMNVLLGERYKIMPEAAKKLLLGEFGQTVKQPNPEVLKKAIGDAPRITCRPADRIAPQLAQFEKACVKWKQKDEDVLTYALFPDVAEKFFEYRDAQQTGFSKSVADCVNVAYPV